MTVCRQDQRPGVKDMLQWDEARYSLGVEGMDVTHREFAQLAEALAKAGDEDFPVLFQELLDHTRLHFAEEGRLMRLCKFPPIAIHEAEHARVLGDLIQLNRHIQTGRLPLARAYVRSGLPEWFELHLATMDRALAAYMLRTMQPA
jgi:hemerythrin-like metal-binding protein